MATSLSYVAVRDDKAARSLSVNEREFLRASAHAPAILRLDGRRGDEIRKVRMKLGRWDNGAECTVQWGVGTRVTALCTAELVPPSTDRPNEGIVNFTVDLSPMAGTAFRQAPPVGTAPLGSSTVTSRGPNFADKSQRLLSNRILRSIERIVLLGGALDTEALVLIHGSWVWKITVALTVLDDGGNVLDPCVMAALAALRHYRKPQVDVGESSEDQDGTNAALPSLIPATVKEPIPLPLHHTPLSISFALVPSNDNIPKSTVATLVDPEKREELVHFGALTVALNTHLVSFTLLFLYGAKS
jgi:exosome complex component RRP45